MSVLDLVRTVAPVPLVTLDQAKAHLNVLHDEDDQKIEDLIEACVDQLDGYSGETGLTLVEQTWELHLTRFPAGRVLALPLQPLISVESITFKDPDGVTQTFNLDQVTVRPGLKADITLKSGASWAATACDPRAVTITFKAGYGAPADAPAAYRLAVLVMLTANYHSPEGAVSMPPAAQRLISPRRRRRI
ncbi:head-tail connector protein [Caulobacter sp.]|uniref:head-tail connector protein n=1 Tax=Caulobacter sp. TaxID=78 RepID=UPI003BB150EE